MKIRWYHWLVYKLFYRMWNPIFKSRPDMAKFFVDYMNQWVKENG
jgi:hypothetical protein